MIAWLFGMFHCVITNKTIDFAQLRLKEILFGIKLFCHVFV